jgi:hypothetical protein
VDGIHKVAHHETSSAKITTLFYFLWPITMPLFFDPVEIMAMAALSIPAFSFYSYIRPYYTYVTAVHTLTFSLLVLSTVFIGPMLPLLNVWYPGAIPDHTPESLWPALVLDTTTVLTIMGIIGIGVVIASYLAYRK